MRRHKHRLILQKCFAYRSCVQLADSLRQLYNVENRRVRIAAQISSTLNHLHLCFTHFGCIFVEGGCHLHGRVVNGATLLRVFDEVIERQFDLLRTVIDAMIVTGEQKIERINVRCRTVVIQKV